VKRKGFLSKFCSFFRVPRAKIDWEAWSYTNSCFWRGTRHVPLSKFQCFLQTQRFVLKLLKLTMRRKFRRGDAGTCWTDCWQTDRQTLLGRNRSRPSVHDERNCGKGTRCNLNDPIRANEFAARKPKLVMVINMDDHWPDRSNAGRYDKWSAGRMRGRSR
jgi:hypothetical protein